MSAPWHGFRRRSRFQPYGPGGASLGPTGDKSVGGCRRINPFFWPPQERSDRSWWGPSLYGPPWWGFLPGQNCVLALVRTTGASIGIIRHVVGFLVKRKREGCCRRRCGRWRRGEEEQGAAGGAVAEAAAVAAPAAEGGTTDGEHCGSCPHNHSQEVYGISRFWMSTELGSNPRKQDVTFYTSGNASTEVRTVVLGDDAADIDGTIVDSETGEMARVARDGESGELVFVQDAVRDLTQEIVLTESLYEIDLRRRYFSDPAKHGHLVRELGPESGRLVRHLTGDRGTIEAIPVDGEQLIALCHAYGFSEAETQRVLNHFSYVTTKLEDDQDRNGERKRHNSSGVSFTAALNGGFGPHCHNAGSPEQVAVNGSAIDGATCHHPSHPYDPHASSPPTGEVPGYDGEVPNGDDAMDCDMDDFLTRNEAVLTAGAHVQRHLVGFDESESVVPVDRGVPFDAECGEVCQRM